MVYNWLNSIQNQIYPAICILCGSSGDNDLDLCASCHDQLPANPHPCRVCALPLPVADNSSLCGQCSRHPPDFQHILAPFLYQPPIDHLIGSFKFRQQLSSGRLLGKLLANHLRAQHYSPPQLILPVPLHKLQLRKRGFNQSAELSRHLSQELGLDWSASLLQKTRPTDSQHGLNRLQRIKNLRHCFKFDNPYQLRHVAVVDDVVTTGSTANEIARTLRTAGVESVQIWALARTP